MVLRKFLSNQLERFSKSLLSSFYDVIKIYVIGKIFQPTE